MYLYALHVGLVVHFAGKQHIPTSVQEDFTMILK